ncbi:PolC-type DNA polymerase III [Candidatus Margulisiibacteriota bacterium]
MSEQKLKINKACPSCETNKSILIEKNRIFCSKQDCNFEIEYACPLCDQEMDINSYQADWQNPYFLCSKCKNKIHLTKIKYLIENQLVVDQGKRCAYCNGPTIHRPTANLSNRCFYFPQCSGQADLFADKKESIVFLDFETTGLEIARDFIIEIGAIKLDSLGCEHTFQTFVSGPEKIPENIIRLTGINHEMIKNAPGLAVGMADLIAFIDDSTIVVHNAEFDLLWLLTAAIRHDIKTINNKVICTIQWAKKQNEPRCSLKALTKKYSIPHNSAHRALADAAATKELFFIFENLKAAPKPVDKLDKYLSLSQNLVNKNANYFQK